MLLIYFQFGSYLHNQRLVVFSNRWFIASYPLIFALHVSPRLFRAAPSGSKNFCKAIDHLEGVKFTAQKPEEYPSPIWRKIHENSKASIFRWKCEKLSVCTEKQLNGTLFSWLPGSFLLFKSSRTFSRNSSPNKNWIIEANIQQHQTQFKICFPNSKICLISILILYQLMFASWCKLVM